MGRTAQVDTPVPAGLQAGDDAGTDAERPLRKDARRNRDALLTAASEAYSERGMDASLEDIARRAGVGIGTLYRHFPTRDAVTEAVYRREVQTLCDGVDELIASREPIDALRAWMISFAGYVAKKRGMAMALKAHFGPDSELFTTSRTRIHAAVDAVVQNAVDAGAIRPDADSGDVLGALSGICMAVDTPGWNDRTGRLVDLIVDGLRYGAPRS